MVRSGDAGFGEAHDAPTGALAKLKPVVVSMLLADMVPHRADEDDLDAAAALAAVAAAGGPGHAERPFRLWKSTSGQMVPMGQLLTMRLLRRHAARLDLDLLEDLFGVAPAAAAAADDDGPVATASSASSSSGAEGGLALALSESSLPVVREESNPYLIQSLSNPIPI